MQPTGGCQVHPGPWPSFRSAHAARRARRGYEAALVAAFVVGTADCPFGLAGAGRSTAIAAISQKTSLRATVRRGGARCSDAGTGRFRAARDPAGAGAPPGATFGIVAAELSAGAAT